MVCLRWVKLCAVACLGATVAAVAMAPSAFAQAAGAQGDKMTYQTPGDGKTPPKSWVDAATGHRVWRLSDEPSSSAFYFNVNGYTPDGKLMVYNAPDGIHVLELATKKTRLVVPGRVHTIIVGSKTPRIFYTKTEGPDGAQARPGTAGTKSSVWAADLYTGEQKKLVDLPARAGVATINADETLAAGTYTEGQPTDAEYGAQRKPPVDKDGKPLEGNLVQPMNKGEMMERRLAARIPIVLFTINLNDGKMTVLQKSTDWVNHLLFSPKDPTLLMYCHEGPWQKVDRIWTIRTDGTQNTLIHKRTMAQEIAGHEFWGIDGTTIWYDLQTPKGEDFFLAGYNTRTKERRWYHMQRNEWSIHFNVTADESLFTGDGGDPGQVAKAPDGEWIELFHPAKIAVSGINDASLIQPGVFHSEHLVKMDKHNYKLEPNVRFSPDKSMVIFTSNMYGPSYVFGVEVAKAQ